MAWPVQLGLLIMSLASYGDLHQHVRPMERSQALAASAQRDSSDRLAEAVRQRYAREGGQQLAEARQPPPPPWCSPTCSHGLMLERENWRKRMTEPE